MVIQRADRDVTRHVGQLCLAQFTPTRSIDVSVAVVDPDPVMVRLLLENVVVFNERHLRRLLREYVAYYHDDRTHLGLGKATPAGRTMEWRLEGEAKVVALPRVGGLHHRYEWRAAA